MIRFLELSPKNQDSNIYIYITFNQIWFILWMMDSALIAKNWGGGDDLLITMKLT